MPNTKTTRGARGREAAASGQPEYLTTAEVARHLRLNQKKVYALLAENRLPAARVSGKWLFPRTLIERWVAEHTVYPPTGVMGALLDKLLVIQGSDDWLLGRSIDALRARPDFTVVTGLIGSIAGLRALAGASAHVAGCHVDDAEVLRFVPEGDTWYLVDLVTREQVLMFPHKLRSQLPDLRAVATRRLRFADRQPLSGTHALARRLFAEAGADARKLRTVGPYASHLEVGLAVRAGLADAGIGVRIAAELCGLDAITLACETFRLAIPGGYFGHPRIGAFLQGLLEELESARRNDLAGYGFESLGRTRPLQHPARRNDVRRA